MKSLSLTARSLGTLPLDECLAGVRALGFAGVDLGVGQVPANSWESATTEGRADLRRRIADAGLEVSGMAIGSPGPYPLREGIASGFRADLRLAADLGIRMLRIESAIPPDSPVPAAARAILAGISATWKASARLAADEGVRLLWDFPDGGHAQGAPAADPATDATARALDLVARVDEPNFGLVLRPDRAEGHAAPGPAATLDRLEGVAGAVLFSGASRDLDALLPALLKADVPTAWWTLDLGPGREPGGREAVAAWLETLNAFLSNSGR